MDYAPVATQGTPRAKTGRGGHLSSNPVLQAGPGLRVANTPSASIFCRIRRSPPVCPVGVILPQFKQKPSANTPSPQVSAQNLDVVSYTAPVRPVVWTSQAEASSNVGF